ncbi:hypothetical protein Tco_0719154 [Tanacetum coccineum]
MVMGDKRGELKASIRNEKLDVLSGLMDQRGVAIVREGTAPRVNLDESGATCDGNLKAGRNVILNESDSMPNGVPSVKDPNDPNADDNMHAAGVSAKGQPKVNSNFRSLVADPVFDGVNISIPRKVVKKAKHGLKRIMMNNKGFFFFKFDSRAGLEAVLEGGPWLILFEEDGISLIVIFIGKPVMLDSYTSSMCNDSWGRSSFARCLIELSSEADLVDVVTIGIPSLIGEDFTKETICVRYEWRPPRCDKKRKGKSKSNNGGQFAGPSVKQTVRYEPKATTNTPKNGATNKEEVENVYDETANLFTKTGGSSFTAAAG